jgi:hypothetical protein
MAQKYHKQGKPGKCYRHGESVPHTGQKLIEEREVNVHPLTPKSFQIDGGRRANPLESRGKDAQSRL